MAEKWILASPEKWGKNGPENGRKMARKMEKKWPENGSKMEFRAIFPIFRAIFQVRPKSIYTRSTGFQVLMQLKGSYVEIPMPLVAPSTG